MTETYVDERDSSVFEILKGDGASPEVFTLQCVANSGGTLSRKANVTAAVIARCDDPTQPGKTIRKTNSTDTTLTFSGTFDGTTGKTWFDAVGSVANYKIYAGISTGDLTVSGPFVLEDFTITRGKLGDPVDATFTLSQADAPTSSLHA